MATTVGTLLVNVIGDSSGLAASLGSAERQIERFGSRLFFLGSRITAGITLPIVGFVTAVNKIGSEFDASMTESLAIMDNVSGEMRSLMEQRAVDISKSSKFAAKDIAQGYYDLASAGLTAQESLDAIGTVATFAQAGLMDMGKAGEFLAGATAALTPKLMGFTDKAQAMARVGDVLTMANNKALGTIQDFANALTNKMAPAMRQQNMSLEDGVAMLMVYADQNIRGKAAGQQAYMVLRDLQSATTKAGAAWKDYGISVFDANEKMRGVPDILDMIKKRMDGFSKGQINDWLKTGVMAETPELAPMTDKGKAIMWKDLKVQDRSRAAIQYLLGLSDQMKKFRDDLEGAEGSAAAVAAKQAQAMAVKWKEALHSIEAAAIKLYASFKPILTDLFLWVGKMGEKLSEWADRFNALEPSTKKLLLIMTGIVAAVGPAIAVLGSFILLWGGSIGGLSGFFGWISKLLTALPTMAARMTAAGYVMSGTATIWASLVKAGGFLWSLLGNILVPLAAMYGLFKVLGPALDRVVSNFQGMSGGLAGIRKSLSDNLGSWEQWKTTIGNAFSILSNLLKMAQFGWVQLVTLFDTYIIPELGQAFMTLWNTIKGAMKGIWNAVSFVFEKITSVLPPAMVAAFNVLYTAVSYIISEIIGITGKALGLIGGIIVKMGKAFLPKELVELGVLFKDVATNSGGFHDAMSRAASGLNTYVNQMGMVDLKARALQGTFESLKGVMGRSGKGINPDSMPLIPLGLGDDGVDTPATAKRDPVNEAYLQLMGEGKKAWQDMSAAFRLHRKEIVGNEDAMDRLWEVYKGVRDTIGPSGLKKDLDALFEKKIGIEQFEKFRENFGAIWDDMHEGQNSLEPFLGLIDAMATSSKNLIEGSGVGGSIFSPDFFKKHAAAIEDLAMTYAKQPPGIKAMIDSYKKWSQAITNSDTALRLHQLNLQHMSPILDAHKSALAKLQDKEKELADFRLTASERALKGISRNMEQQRLAMQKESDEAFTHLSNLSGKELAIATQKFLELKLMQKKYLEVAERADLERLASAVGANALIVQSFKNMEKEILTSIITIQLGARETKALYDGLAEGLNTLAGVFDTSGEGTLSWLGKMAGLMGEATQAGVDMKTAQLALGEAFKGGEFNAKSFAAAAIAGFVAVAQGVAIMDKATQSSSKSKRILGGAMAGAQMGAAFGPWGIAIGAVGGALVGAIRKSGAEQEMKRIAKSFGVDVSEELGKAISEEAKSKYGGNLQLAEHMSLGKILEEGGGLSDKNLTKFKARLSDTFTFMAQGLLTSQEAMDMYSANFGTFADFITSKGEDLATAFIKDFRVMGDMMKKGVMSESDFLGFLDKNFAAFVTNMEKSGHVASKAWAEIVAMHADMGAKSKEMMAFLGGQATTAGSSWTSAVQAVTYDFEGLGDKIDEARKKLKEMADEAKKDSVFSGDQVSTVVTPEMQEAMENLNFLLGRQAEHAKASAEQMGNLSLIILTTFNAGIDAGLGWSEMMESIGPSIDALAKGYKDLGIETDNAGMKALLGLRSMYTANKQLFDGISATTQGMIALSKLGGLTSEAFTAIGDSMVALFRRTQSVMEQTGGTHKDALRPFVQYLAEARHASEEYGYVLDDTTAEMIRQAEELGLLGDEAATEAEVMKDGFDKVNESLGRMISSLDNFIGRLDGLAAGINGLPDPNITWPDMPDYSMPQPIYPVYDPAYPDTPGERTPLELSNVSGSNNDVQQQPASSGGAGLTLVFQDAGSLNRTKIQQEIVPVLVETVRTNQFGARTDLQEALQMDV